MINHIELGKLVPADKTIKTHACLGSFDVFWQEIERNHVKGLDSKVFNKNDWRGAYDRALHFDGLDGCFMRTPSLIDLDRTARYFLLGYSYKEWVKHFNREGFLKACSPSLNSE